MIWPNFKATTNERQREIEREREAIPKTLDYLQNIFKAIAQSSQMKCVCNHGNENIPLNSYTINTFDIVLVFNKYIYRERERVRVILYIFHLEYPHFVEIIAFVIVS